MSKRSARAVQVPASSRTPLTPISFLERSAYVYRHRPATVYGDRTTTYGELLDRVQRLVGALRRCGVNEGDRVATLLPNVPAMLELHFGVPGAGAALVPLNTRLGPVELQYILEHSSPRLIFVHHSLLEQARRALDAIDGRPETIVVGGEADEYESLLAQSEQEPLRIDSEDDLLSINYTSGTTSSPKGVMYIHRGAYLHALGVIASAELNAESRYLWTLPMFHCNGWAFTWAVTAAGGQHICLDAVDVPLVWRHLRAGVTHFCGAPTVLTMLAEADDASVLSSPAKAFVGGAPPSPALLARAERLGMQITQLYGLTETYGPLCVCARQPGWEDLPEDQRRRLQARQGVGTVVSDRLRVVDADLRDVPADGETMGEVMMRGNNVTPGYYRAPDVTAEAFAGGWFHSGDLAVMHEDGYIELRDRSKDVIISGGENISTIEIEHALCEHPGVVEAAVIGIPDERWGEVPKAFVTARGEQPPDTDELRDWIRDRLARYKTPREIVFVQELPKTATNKVQKFILRETAGRDRSGVDH